MKKKYDKCSIGGCEARAFKTRIIFGVYYNFCKIHNIKDLKTL